MNASAEPESPIVARARQGDQAAMGLLYRSHHARVTGHVRRLLGADPDVDDLVQEAFVSAFRSLHGFRGEALFGTWLHRITARVVRRHLRRRIWRRSKHNGHVRESVAALQQASSPVDRMVARDDVRRLYEGLDRLSPKLREAFVLRYVEDLSLEQGAAVAGVRSKTLAVRTHRALKALRNFLGFPTTTGG